MPTRGQEKRLKELAEQAMEAKRLTFAGATPPNKLAASVRALADELAAKAPAYLQPSAQLKLLHTAADCLAVLELAVNWEAEKLYGVEALGPFEEF
jgi:type II secretory pathway component HofQ